MQLTITHGIRQRHVEIILRGDRWKPALRIEKVIRKRSFEGFYSQTSANVLGLVSRI
jgi:hypothetical protein